MVEVPLNAQPLTHPPKVLVGTQVTDAHGGPSGHSLLCPSSLHTTGVDSGGWRFLPESEPGQDSFIAMKYLSRRRVSVSVLNQMWIGLKL